MGLRLLVFFLAPIAEMYLLIRVGGYIGALYTVGLVILTGVLGVLLVRYQGFQTLTRGMSRLQEGQVPAREMAEGLLLAVAGVLLIVPGFVTDAVGLVLLVPPVRAVVARRMLARVVVGAVPGDSAGSQAEERSHSGDRFRSGERSHRVIEGEFESHVDPDDDASGGNPRDRRLP